jgi:hypothetical protein
VRIAPTGRSTTKNNNATAALNSGLPGRRRVRKCPIKVLQNLAGKRSSQDLFMPAIERGEFMLIKSAPARKVNTSGRAEVGLKSVPLTFSRFGFTFRVHRRRTPIATGRIIYLHDYSDGTGGQRWRPPCVQEWSQLRRLAGNHCATAFQRRQRSSVVADGNRSDRRSKSLIPEAVAVTPIDL